MSDYDAIILSPGPGLPHEAPLLFQTLDTFAGSKPILGVCLGMQAIGEFYGCTLRNLPKVMHGIQTKCVVDTSSALFRGLSKEITVGHYHSWVIDEDSLVPELQVIARNDNGLIMGIQHKTHSVTGVQFHPESVLTPDGKFMIRNWIEGSK